MYQKTMQFSISRDNFSIRTRCCPRKITKKRSVSSNSTTFYVLCHAKCLLNRVMKGMSISSNPKSLCYSNDFFSSLIRSANLEFQSLDLLSKNYGTKKWNRGINLTSIEFTTQVSTDRFRLKLLVMRYLTSRKLSSIGLEQTQNMNFALSKIGFSFIQRLILKRK